MHGFHFAAQHPCRRIIPADGCEGLRHKHVEGVAVMDMSRFVGKDYAGVGIKIIDADNYNVAYAEGRYVSVAGDVYALSADMASFRADDDGEYFQQRDYVGENHSSHTGSPYYERYAPDVMPAFLNCSGDVNLSGADGYRCDSGLSAQNIHKQRQHERYNTDGYQCQSSD